jgi:hypothetical protein
MLHMDAVSGEWVAQLSSAVGAKPTPIRSEAGVAALTDVVRNRRLVYMGDSTARNPAIVLVALLCNRASFANCRHVASANGNDGNRTALTCAIPIEGDDPSVFGRGAGNVCRDIVRSYVVPLVNITLTEMPTLAVRKKLWATGKLPPMNRIVVASLNFTVDIVEAGCGMTDGVEAVMDKLLTAHGRSQEDRVHIVRMFPPPPPASREAGVADLDKGDSRGAFISRPFFAQYDAVVVAAGLHCTAKRWGRRWYVGLARSVLPKVARLAPVVFVEITHCRKTANGKLLSCPRIGQHVPSMQQTYTAVAGVYVAPTRNTTAINGFAAGVHGSQLVNHPMNVSERRATVCEFVDFVHPGLSCYGAVAFSIAQSVGDAIADYAKAKATRPECFVPTAAELSASPPTPLGNGSASSSQEQELPETQPPSESLQRAPGQVAVPTSTAASIGRIRTSMPLVTFTATTGEQIPETRISAEPPLPSDGPTSQRGDAPTSGVMRGATAPEVPGWTWFLCGAVVGVTGKILHDRTR